MSVIKVGIADLSVAKAPDILTTLGLGSCIGITLYDPTTKIGGLVHIMLPDSTQIKNNDNRAKFADTGIQLLIDRMIREGARRTKLVAKIAGGAHMFDFKNVNDMMRIGSRNIAATIRILKEEHIPLLAQDTGENYGRTIEFDTATGILCVKTVGHGIRNI